MSVSAKCIRRVAGMQYQPPAVDVIDSKSTPGVRPVGMREEILDQNRIIRQL